ncbi:hypothetical protein CRUP_014199 [Coryphaenoides rupestris]|nr:hypothetical protein CRUP_014199 [Coryphaenoides rupestris]
MAAPAVADAGGGGEFEAWLGDRLDSLEIDGEVYGAYLLGVLREVDCDDDEKAETLRGILSAFLEGDTLEDVCKQIFDEWTEHCGRSVKCGDEDADVQAITSLMEKQAQIVVKQKELPGDSKTNKEAVLAQYGNITDEEEYPWFFYDAWRVQIELNTNVEQVLSRQKEKREQAREDSRKKKETDKTQREKDKVAKQDRKEKEKKRTQKGERKR